MPNEPHHDHEHSHDNEHDHHHGHEHDQGLKGFVRYLQHAPKMWRSEVNDAVVARINPQAGETVMDIGAGIGAGAMVAAKSGCTVMAVEPTPYMRHTLKLRRLITRTVDSVHVIDGTAEATTVAAGSIDAAWAVNTMHHWGNLESGVAELARVLAPGGRVLLVDEAFDDPTHPSYEEFAPTREKHAHHFDTVNPEVVAAAMRTAGLTVNFAGHQAIAGRPSIVVDAVQVES